MTTLNEVKATDAVKDGLETAGNKVKEVLAPWDEKMGKLKLKFPTLTDADLKFEEGKKDDMLALVQIKLGKSKEELQAIIAAL